MSLHRIHVVSLPGWLFPPDCFHPLRDALDTACDWTSLSWPQALDPAGMAQILANMPGRCVLVAWSLGSLAALQLALDPPTPLAGLLLISATARLPAQEADGYPGVSQPLLNAMRRRLRSDPEGLFRDFFRLCRQPDHPLPAEQDTFLEGAMQSPRSTAKGGLDALTMLDLRASLPSIPLPVRLLHGTADAVVPPDQGQALADGLPRGRLRTLSGVGHAAPALLHTAAADELQQLLLDIEQ